jgi:hypothetical protein
MHCAAIGRKRCSAAAGNNRAPVKNNNDARRQAPWYDSLAQSFIIAHGMYQEEIAPRP